MSRARAVVESIALAAVLVLPWYVAVFTERVFEAEKMAALRALALPAAVACLAYGASADRRGRLVALWRTSAAAPRWLAGAAALFWLAEGVTTLSSRAPLVSLLGSYDRGFGWLSTTALAVLAVGAAGIAARPGGAERLAAFIGASLLPPSLYGIGQRFGADPLPWFGDVVTRVSGSAGASVMLGAHIALALPFALWATASAYRISDRPSDEDSTRVPAQLRLAAWLLIDATAVIALVLSGSRGPALALAGALGIAVLVVAARHGRRRWAVGVVTVAILALVALGALNRWPAAFGPIAQLPLVDRLAFALDANRSTTRVRLRLWEGSVAAVGDLGLRTPVPRHWTRSGWPTEYGPRRLCTGGVLVGTGPETMPLTWAAHYPSILAYDEPRGWVPDRAHNLWLDRLLTTGALGTLALLGLIVAAFVAALVARGLIAGRREAAAAVATWLGAAMGAAIAARVADGGWRLAAPAFGLGLVGGVALWLAFLSTRRRSDGGGDRLGLPITALAMLSAFVIETQVGFVVTPTAVILWLTLGALAGAAVGQGRDRRQGHEQRQEPDPQLEHDPRQHDPRQEASRALGDGMFAAALIAITGLFGFGRSGLVGSGWVGALVFVVVASGAVGLAIGDGRPQARRSALGMRGDALRVGALRVGALRVGVLIAAATLAHGLALRLGTDGPSDAVPAAAMTLAVWVAAIGVVIALRAGVLDDVRRHSVVAAGTTVTVGTTIALALSTTVADAAYKEGRAAWEAGVPSWRARGDSGRAEALLDGAVERYRLAAALSPFEARYRLALGMAEDVRGDLLTEALTGELERAGRAETTDEYAVVAAGGAGGAGGAGDTFGADNTRDSGNSRDTGDTVADLAQRRDAAFERAMDAFAAARRLSPGDPVATLAQARGLRVWGDLTREPTRRAARLAAARAAYAAARTQAPNWPEVLSEAAMTELLDGDVQAARTLAEQAVALDGFYYQGWKTIAQARLADADPAGAAAAWARYFDDPRNAGDVAAMRARAAAQLQAGDAAGALGTAQAVVRLAPDDARAWADLAVLRDGTGDRRGAIEAAERAAALSPGDDGIGRLLDGLSAPERP